MDVFLVLEVLLQQSTFEWSGVHDVSTLLLPVRRFAQNSVTVQVVVGVVGLRGLGLAPRSRSIRRLVEIEVPNILKILLCGDSIP